METTEARKTFDFSKEKVLTITLQELEATYKENDVYGRPLGGIYHSDLINGISDIARSAGLEVEMGDMFAVNNLDGKRPGVALLPEVEEKEGERSIRAHLLRRVFATVHLQPQGIGSVGIVDALPEAAHPLFCSAIAIICSLMYFSSTSPTGVCLRPLSSNTLSATAS